MKTRALTALALIPVVLAAVFWGASWPLWLLLTLLAALGVDELSRLGRRSGGSFAFVGAACLIAYWLWLPSEWAQIHLQAQLMALTAVGAVVAPLAVRRGSSILVQVASLWVAAPLAAIGVLHVAEASTGPWNPRSPVLLLALPLWAGDTLAYVVGRRFGKRPLWRAVSPNKTIEGAVANLVGSIAVAGLLSAWTLVPIGVCLMLGAVAGTLGQLGDLFQSWLKRTAGAKDSGSLLPGHGGVLDRIDSLLFAAPVQALILAVSQVPGR